MPIIKSSRKMPDYDRIRKWLGNIPNIYNGAFRRLYLKALQRKSLKAAIRAKCEDCMCWENSEIKRCEIITCPLWRYRPGSKTHGEAEEKIGAIAARLEKELKAGSVPSSHIGLQSDSCS